MNKKQHKISTIGIFAHANAGKTTITEHLLFHTGIINDIGRVDNGNTVTDDMKIEQERGITVRDSVVSFNIKDKKIQLIDTPGHVDFSAEVERAINVLDGAILVISGVEGLEAQTYTIWKALKEKKIPVIIFINKMDRKGADFKKVLLELQNNLKVPVIALKRALNNNDNLIIESTPFKKLIEELSMIDEKTLGRYINEEIITEKEIDETIIKLANSCNLFPVIGGSALIDVGISDLIEAIYKYIPSTPIKDEDEFMAYVFMIRPIKKVYLKILKGSLAIRDNIKIDELTEAKVKSLYIYNGAKLMPVDKAYSGDIVVINGLDVKCGELIGNITDMDKYISFVKPLFIMEICPEKKEDNIRLMEALKILNEEDPYLDVKYNKRTNSIFCSLMGEVQAQIIKALLIERFGITTNIKNPIIIHKETPTISARAKASYTTVSGIEIEITPLERGEGFHYISKISTDYLHLKYQRQIERLINYYSKQGLNGWELTDIEMALVGGQFDSMGSDPLHFNIITPLALFRALKKAQIKLLEPILKFVITTPEKDLSTIINLMTLKNSFFEIKNNLNQITTIEGEAPASNMLNFPLELSMATGGRGTYSSYIYKYEISHNQKAQIEYIGPDPRNETTFVINDMKSSMEPLDKTLMKKKKESRSKFVRIKREKEYRK